MLLIQDNLMKLGGVKLSGQMKSIEITEMAKIENIEDDKGRIKATQPTGYEPAKITVEIIIEATKHESEEDQIIKLQKLFRPYGQDKAKLMQIVNEDCRARGISQVYFLGFSTQKITASGGRIATLEFTTGVKAGIKTKAKKTGNGKNTNKSMEQVSYKKPYTTKKTTKSPVYRKIDINKLRSNVNRMLN